MSKLLFRNICIFIWLDTLVFFVAMAMGEPVRPIHILPGGGFIRLAEAVGHKYTIDK